MAVAFAHYSKFLYKDGTEVPGRTYQNFFVGETRVYDSVNYYFAPYGISGLASSRNGDVPQATLIAACNQITVPLFSQVVLNRWLLEIKTVAIKINEDRTFTESGTISQELWACTGGTSDSERVSITLSSPINAVDKQVPGRVLTRAMVGAIPPTGQIVIS